ncbi:hypothetical protein NIES4071_83180 [Calothrix sp. NIES-4071]|nr:hypothetical protein NIES4071_83180 [Calothrix sp. NIES-4071]BAZ62586.1 hypothetical protein NIES4105_83110 [Calothrix sp. NIES-4105]
MNNKLKRVLGFFLMCGKAFLETLDVNSKFVFAKNFVCKLDRKPSNNGKIIVKFAQQPPLCFFPISELEFFAVAVNTKIKFEKDAIGNIQALTANQSGKQIRAERDS